MDALLHRSILDPIPIPQRMKRQAVNPHEYNPIAYLSYLNTRITGEVHSFDLEMLHVESARLSGFIENLRKAVDGNRDLILQNRRDLLKLVNLTQTTFYRTQTELQLVCSGCESGPPDVVILRPQPRIGGPLVRCGV